MEKLLPFLLTDNCLFIIALLDETELFQKETLAIPKEFTTNSTACCTVLVTRRRIL